jgi:hypothetical protein
MEESSAVLAVLRLVVSSTLWTAGSWAALSRPGQPTEGECADDELNVIRVSNR